MLTAGLYNECKVKLKKVAFMHGFAHKAMHNITLPKDVRA